MDKNKAVLEFITTYSGIATSPIFVNFINAKNNDIQVLTNDNDITLNRKFIDGSVMKQYTFSIVVTKSITSLALIKDGIISENVDDLADMQAFMDWVNEQGELENYPNFGDSCVIEEMRTTAENPSIDGITSEPSPPLALYSMEIRIIYIDYSKVIYNKT